MKADNEELAKILARLKAKAASRPKLKPRPRDGAKVDLVLLADLKELHPKLIHELAKRMDMTRQGIYWMMRDDYGGSEPAKEAVKRLNDILKDLLKEIKDSVRHAGSK